MIGPGPHSGRISRLRSALGRQGTSAVLITHLPNVRWLCGFTGSAGSMLVSARDAAFFTDCRYREQARREVRGARRVEYPSGAVESLARAVRATRVSRLGFEAERMTVACHADLAAALPRVELVPLRGTVERLRAVKDAGELAAMRGALAVADRALVAGRRGLAGRSEIEVKERLEAAIRLTGGHEVSFPTIVASGPRGALPHGLPTRRIIGGDDLVVMDFGVRHSGYCCDVTRTIPGKKWVRKAKELYLIVLEAQREALSAVRPGVKASDVDAAARGVIDRSGFGRQFGHGTGHGVGLEVHELPCIGPRSGEILEPGMVFTVEPGIYVENFGGVRIEDMVLVTSTGREVMSRRIPKLLDR